MIEDRNIRYLKSDNSNYSTQTPQNTMKNVIVCQYISNTFLVENRLTY